MSDTALISKTALPSFFARIFKKTNPPVVPEKSPEQIERDRAFIQMEHAPSKQYCLVPGLVVKPRELAAFAAKPVAGIITREFDVYRNQQYCGFLDATYGAGLYIAVRGMGESRFIKTKAELVEIIQKLGLTNKQSIWARECLVMAEAIVGDVEAINLAVAAGLQAKK